MTPIFAVITPLEVGVVILLAVLLFGADRIPKLARSMGEAKKEFEAATRGQTTSESTPPSNSGTSSAPGAPPTAPTPPAAPQQ